MGGGTTPGAPSGVLPVGGADRLVLTEHAFRNAHARDVAVAAARAGWLGRLARKRGLLASLDGIYDRQEEVELAIYRAHHAQAVAAASPLALDLLAHEGLDVDAIVGELRPRAEWRRWVCGAAPRTSQPLGRWSLGRAGGGEEDAAEVDAFLHGCHVLRPWGDPAGGLGVRCSDTGLEIGAQLGGVHLRTLRGEVALTVDRELPQTVRVGATGVRVDRIFDHPAFWGRPYVIEWSGDYDGYSILAVEDRPAWRVTFRAEPVAWRVPWAR